MVAKEIVNNYIKGYIMKNSEILMEKSFPFGYNNI